MMNAPIVACGDVVPRFHEGQTVLVAALSKKDGKPTCTPVAKTVRAVGNSILIFTDGKSQQLEKCFLDTPAGKEECLSWCEQVQIFQEAFKWPICAPP